MSYEIVLVDDALRCRYLVEYAKEFYGLNIEWVENPVVIINNIDEYVDCKVFILDIMFDLKYELEGINGVELLLFLRNSLGGDFIAIFSSARNEKFLNSIPLVKGVDYNYYFRKPYDMDKLLDLLKKLLSTD